VRDKRLKREMLATRALAELGVWLDQMAAAHR
jgi:hypothetical protein